MIGGRGSAAVGLHMIGICCPLHWVGPAQGEWDKEVATHTMNRKTKKLCTKKGIIKIKASVRNKFPYIMDSSYLKPNLMSPSYGHLPACTGTGILFYIFSAATRAHIYRKPPIASRCAEPAPRTSVPALRTPGCRHTPAPRPLRLSRQGDTPPRPPPAASHGSCGSG